MRPDDETREPEERREARVHARAGGARAAGAASRATRRRARGAAAGDLRRPPPRRGAGRRRDGGRRGAGGRGPGSREPRTDGQAEDSDDLRTGFTEEFDEIERDLDAELAGLERAGDRRRGAGRGGRGGR